MNNLLIAQLAAMSLILSAHGQLRADIILDTGTLVYTGSGGASMTASQFLGADFSLSTETTIDHIGGAMSNFGSPGTFFGAIVPVSGPTSNPSFPQSSLTAHALAHTTFTLSSLTDTNVSFPLSVTLPAGNYALIYGSGLYGTSGNGAMSDDATNTLIGDPYFMFANSQYPNWTMSSNADPEIFVITGTAAVPEPSSLLLCGIVIALFGLRAWRGRTRRALDAAS